MEIVKYEDKYYDDLVNFLIEINQEEQEYINWNWARLEWMIGHPYFDSSLKSSIGLWIDDNKIVGAALFDMYLGEAFIGALKEYQYLYKEILEYAWTNIKDDQGLGIAISDTNIFLLSEAINFGFFKAKNKETMASISLAKNFNYTLPNNIRIEEVKREDAFNLSFAIWQGFDHGSDLEEFKKDYQEPVWRKHQNPYLQLKAINQNNQIVGYCGFWYNNKTDYAYLEPLCIIPNYRGQGIGKSLVYEGFNRALKLGAKKALVLSDNDFYFKIGMEKEKTFNFYWKKEEMIANGKMYKIEKLLGKGKGGYSYLAKDGINLVVLKKIHHEPCSYYQFGNKIEAEKNDYFRLLNAKIRIPRMIDIDLENEIIIKEYVDGKTIYEMVANDEDITSYLEQVKEMAKLAKEAGLNIDYFPTNFVVQNGLIYYVDYECNNYMEEWNLENWGIKYWSKTEEFIKYMNNKS